MRRVLTLAASLTPVLAHGQQVQPSNWRYDEYWSVLHDAPADPEAPGTRPWLHSRHRRYRYWRASRQDGVYDVPGQLIREGNRSEARFIGTQTEAVIGWQADEALSFTASYSVFRPGTFIRQSGPARVIHMVGAEAMVRF